MYKGDVESGLEAWILVLISFLTGLVAGGK